MGTMTVVELSYKLDRVREMSPDFNRPFWKKDHGKIEMGFGLEVNRRMERLWMRWKRDLTTMKRR